MHTTANTHKKGRVGQGKVRRKEGRERESGERVWMRRWGSRKVAT